MKTASQNKTIAQQALAQRPASPTELETVLDYIDREAENGGLEITTTLSAGVVTQLVSLGYQTTETASGSGVYSISWDV